MKHTEIATLLANGVDKETVAAAIIAGKMATIVKSAANEIYVAEFHSDSVDWDVAMKLVHTQFSAAESEVRHKGKLHDRRTNEYD